ncbi:MAG: HlyD family type I secretion periplasmic adaptor subunit [Hyphomicrobium sp.]
MSTPLSLPAGAMPANSKPASITRDLISVRRYMAYGFLTMLALFGGMGGWAATTDLAGAVIATGSVVVAGNVKKVQHPTGGVVRQILVKNGDTVKAGDIVVRLDETVTRASLQLVTKQIDELSGRLARLKAERDDAPSVTFPADLLARTDEPDVAQIVTGEQNLFESRIKTRSNQRQQLGERITGLRQESAGNTAQAEAKSREISLIKKELEGLERLEAQQLVRTEKMTGMRREQARIEGEMAQLSAAAGQSKDRIAEIEMQRLSIDSEAKSEAIKELRETQGKLVELSERRTAALDQLQRVDIRSPADGIVDQMTVFTVGGVINTGEPLMVVVPQDEQLVIDAKIAPHDIEQARSHKRAVIRFPAFNQRTTPSLNGSIKSVSAEVTKERETNQQYYVARIKIDDDEMMKLGDLQLIPGMPVDIQIRTTERSALSYLVKPIQDQFAKAFKER